MHSVFMLYKKGFEFTLWDSRVSVMLDSCHRWDGMSDAVVIYMYTYFSMLSKLRPTQWRTESTGNVAKMLPAAQLDIPNEI